jgi:NAD(P)-dependent dehydrogenase (short-subunit alcohol dehydrogenase family)
MTRRFDNKIAAITGAGSGIGRALAVQLAKEGCSVAISDVNEEGLNDTSEMIAKYNVGCQKDVLDVSDQEAVERWAGSVIENLGGADYVFNNAGVTLMQSAAETKIEDFRWVMDINFWGMVYGSKAFLPHFMKQKSGHIINVSSLFGLIAFPNQAAYNSSKFAIRGFTEALALEQKENGIHVSSVHPGGIGTGIVQNARIPQDTDGTMKKEAQNRFNKAAITTAEQAANVILDGVDKGRRRILIGKDARFMDRIQRFLPEKYGNFIHKTLAKNNK